jgi:acyl-CoA thioesterase-1
MFSYFIVSLLFISCKQSAEESALDQDEQSTTPSTGEQPEDKSGTILFFGDSITAGYGLDDTDDAFPGLIQERIDSLNLDYDVINSGVSGETTAGGKSRINWVMNQQVDVFVLELGANDGLRGVPVNETKSNLIGIIETVREKSPDTQIILAGMQLPPNFGQEYTAQFSAIFPEIAEEKDLSLIPFILKGVGGVKELNQSDGIHPTAQGHEIIAQTVWETLGPMLTE